MKYIHLAFDILPAGWWTPGYVDQPSAETIVTSIKAEAAAIRAGVSNSDPQLLAGFERYFRSMYLRECLVGEGIMDDQGGATVSAVENLLESTSQSRLAETVRNLDAGLTYLFPTTVFFPGSSPEFTWEFVQRLHEVIGMGIIESAGT
ncbi:hypothetical protein HDU98_002667, partial [Podochytrium sp. JEL0797]